MEIDKLTEAQEDALAFIVVNEALDFAAYQVAARQRRTLEKLQEQGYIRFFPYSSLSWSKNGVWKATKEGKLYAIEHGLIELIDDNTAALKEVVDE